MNRIAIDTDKLTYGDYITSGDLIIDVPTKIYSDGSKEVIYYFIGSKDWLTLREGATIWIDGDKLGFVNKIQFRNTANELTPWHIKSARIKNIPFTRIQTGTISCHGLVNFELDGVSEQYPGLLKWNPSRKFLADGFGIQISNKAGMFGGHGIEATVLNGGNIKLSGFDVKFGFSGVRLCGSSNDLIINSITISNFYIHDMGDSEGFYLGATHSPPLAKLKNLVINNGILARTGSEAIQVQHLIGNADISDIIVYRADTKWLNAFGAGQDTGIQWVISSGINKLRNIIVDGFASQGMVPFGSDQDLLNAPSGKSFVENILFNDGGNTGMYLHNSAKYGINWNFKDLYYRQFNGSYTTRTGQPLKSFIISKKWGTDKIKFERIVHDGSKPNVFEDTTGIEVGEIVLDITMPAPKYVNSGFDKPASTIKQWSQYIAPYFPASKAVAGKATILVPTFWDFDDIAIDARTGGTYVFCKCIVAHEATSIKPLENSNFIPLTWDANGIRSDKSNWEAKTVQSNFPPDDLRLAMDCFWRKKGFGVKGIIQRENIIDNYIFDGEEVILTDSKIYKRKV